MMMTTTMTMTMITTTTIAKTAVVVCFLWVMLMPLMGGGSYGKDILAFWASESIFNDKKAGVPMLMLCVPILTAGTIATLFATTSSAEAASTSSSNSKCGAGSQTDPRWYTVLLIFLPCLVYTCSSLIRHLVDYSDMSTDEVVMESANVFGMVAVIVMSWILLPVSIGGTSGGPIGQLFRKGCKLFSDFLVIIPAWWDESTIIQQFHMWSGRIVVCAGLIHGMMHTVRYSLQSSAVFWSYMIPPAKCWTNPQSYEPEICEAEDVEDDGSNKCTCYDHLLPFTGWVAGFSLLLIGLSSMYKVRRKQFVVFASLHYTMTPVAIVMVCIHYNKAVLYVSGGALYYLACNAPRWIEATCRRVPQPVSVVSIERIDPDHSHWDRPCLAITMKATDDAMARYRPGMYCRLVVPSISWISHPFTVNQVRRKQPMSESTRSQQNYVRIIFRATGPFTKSLESVIVGKSHSNKCKGATSSDNIGERTFLPSMMFSGWYGSERLVDVVNSHDVVVIVAAGVGITPYLTLIANLKGLMDNDNDPSSLDGRGDGIVMPSAVGRQKLVLHWICRDEALVEYCCREYFTGLPLADSTGQQDSNVDIQINIHLTSRDRDDESFADDKPAISNCNFDQTPGVFPASISNFMSGQSIVDNLRPLVVFVAIAWGGLCVIWSMYQRQESDAFVQRVTTVLSILIYVLTIAIAANFCNCFLKPSYSEWNRLPDGDDVGCGEGGLSAFNENSEGIEMGVRDDLAGNKPLDCDDQDDGAEKYDDQLSTDLALERYSASLINTSRGRPSLNDMMNVLQDGQSPAVLCCVPLGLGHEIHSLVSNRRCGLGGTRRIPIYNESFEL